MPVAQISTQGYYATVADLDGDRLPDVVVARPFSNDVVVLTNAIQHDSSSKQDRGQRPRRNRGRLDLLRHATALRGTGR